MPRDTCLARLHDGPVEMARAESENAVKTQLWCAVAAFAPIAIVRKELQLDASRCT